MFGFKESARGDSESVIINYERVANAIASRRDFMAQRDESRIKSLREGENRNLSLCFEYFYDIERQARSAYSFAVSSHMGVPFRTNLSSGQGAGKSSGILSHEG